MNDFAVGCYVIPSDASDNPDNTHALEGVVWAIEVVVDPETGELVERLHVVRDRHGRELVFTKWRAARVGTMAPADEPTVDRVLKICGRLLREHGRKVDDRVFGVVHAFAGIAKNLPRPEARSIFDHGCEVPPEEEAGWQRRSRPASRPGSLTTSIVGKLCGRLAVLDKNDPQTVNEIRREARDKGLMYLDDAAVMPLADLAQYDTILRRWEKHQARKQAS